MQAVNPASIVSRILVVVLLLVSSILEAKDNCVPAHEAVKFPHDGLYHRIHPSGNYFLYTEGSKSTLVDITNRGKPVALKTPMREEAYPVEGAKGGWELVASPVNGGAQGPNGGTDYFAFRDLAQGADKSLKPAYTDPRHGEYYHSSAELPGSTDKLKKVRTLLYSDRIYRDYDMKVTGQGKVGEVVPGKKGNICENVFGLPFRSAQSKAKFKAAIDEIEQLKVDFRNNNRNAPYDEVKAFQERMQAKLLAAEIQYYGPEYAANRVAAVATREKSAEATKIFRNMATYVSAESKLKAARREASDAQEAILSDDKVKALESKIAELVREYRSERVSAARRSAIVREHDELQEKKSRTVREVSAASPNVAATRRAVHEAEAAMSKLEDSPEGKRARGLREEVERLDSWAYEFKDGRRFANPVLSKDGTQVAGLVNGEIEVFAIDGKGDCTSIAKTGFRGSKVSFSYPSAGAPLQITFTAEAGASGGYKSQAYVYDLSSAKATVISSAEDRDVSYPGFTLDGRVMYKTSSGMAIVDPLQVKKVGCISADGQRSGKPSQQGAVTR